MYKPCLLLVLFSMCQLAHADTPAGRETPELTTLKTAYQTQVATVTGTVTARYREKLNELMKAQTLRGDLDAAVATRNELNAAGGAPGSPGAMPLAQSPFYGTRWTTGGGGGLEGLEFRRDGTYTHTYQGKVISGSWTTSREPVVISLTGWPNRPDAQIVLTERGTYCVRAMDGQKYKKADPGQAIDGKLATPPPSNDGKPNPFGIVK